MARRVVADMTDTDIIVHSPGFGSVAAANELLAITPKFERIPDHPAYKVPLSWPAVVQLSRLYGKGWMPQGTLAKWIDGQIKLRTIPRDPFYLPPIPKDLTPYPWQAEGAEMIARMGSVMFWDDPGTGKTVTTILGLLKLEAWPAVVVCPASMVTTWVRELNKWAPRLRVIDWRGTPMQREHLGARQGYHVYVVSYGTMRVDAMGSKSVKAPDGTKVEIACPAPLLRVNPETVVLDECHQIKDEDTRQSRAARKLSVPADNLIALSGTPITHDVRDLWPTLACIDFGAFPSKERFSNRYAHTTDIAYGQSEVSGIARDPELRTSILGQTRRISKQDANLKLPNKVYSVRTVDMPPAYRKIYNDMERRGLAEMPDGTELSVMHVLAQIKRLTQLACSACDVASEVEYRDDGEERIHYTVTHKMPSWKISALLEILDERRNGPPVCVWSPWRGILELAEQETRKHLGCSTGFIVGGQSDRARTKIVDSFQAGEIKTLFATTGAGGVGLTLTAAGSCVFIQRPYSIVEAIQAEDRHHRIGSEHESLEVIDIVTANTIELRVREILGIRAESLAEVVQDPRIAIQMLGGAQVLELKRKSA